MIFYFLFYFYRILAEEIHVHIFKKCSNFCKRQWSAVANQVIIKEYLCCNLNEAFFFSKITPRQENSSDCGIFVCKVNNAINKI